MRGHFVHTRMSTGLSKERAGEAIRILNSPNPQLNDLLGTQIEGHGSSRSPQRSPERQSYSQPTRRPQTASSTSRLSRGSYTQEASYSPPRSAGYGYGPGYGASPPISRYDAAYDTAPSHLRGRDVGYARTRPVTAYPAREAYYGDGGYTVPQTTSRLQGSRSYYARDDSGISGISRLSASATPVRGGGSQWTSYSYRGGY